MACVCAYLYTVVCAGYVFRKNTFFNHLNDFLSGRPTIDRARSSSLARNSYPCSIGLAIMCVLYILYPSYRELHRCTLYVCLMSDLENLRKNFVMNTRVLYDIFVIFCIIQVGMRDTTRRSVL